MRRRIWVTGDASKVLVRGVDVTEEVAANGFEVPEGEALVEVSVADFAEAMRRLRDGEPQ